MCDLDVARSLIALEQQVAALQLELSVLRGHPELEDPHPHVHEGYVLRSHLDDAVSACLERAAAAAEAELPPVKEEPAVPVPAPKRAEPIPEPRRQEPGPSTQGVPDRRHALHRRIGGRVA